MFMKDSGNIVLRKADNRKLGLVQSVQEAKNMASIGDFNVMKMGAENKKIRGREDPLSSPEIAVVIFGFTR